MGSIAFVTPLTRLCPWGSYLCGALSEWGYPYASSLTFFADLVCFSPLMLMMRLQRIGRKNDPSYRIVVTDKRTSTKSDRHIDRLGSYNPKMNSVQIDATKAKEWLAKGVQPSDTVYNILVGQKIVEGRKRNVLPRKSPIVDEAALKRAAEEAAAKAKAEADAAAAETPTEVAEAAVAA